MCDQHSTVLVYIPGAEPRGHLGRHRGIDACIAPLVAVLNYNGFPTVASCCGHGHRPGSIILEDGREFIIAPDRETAAVIEQAFPVTAYGEAVGVVDLPLPEVSVQASAWATWLAGRALGGRW